MLHESFLDRPLWFGLCQAMILGSNSFSRICGIYKVTFFNWRQYEAIDISIFSKLENSDNFVRLDVLMLIVGKKELCVG